MPPSGKLSTSELAAIDQWIATGSPDCGGFKAATTAKPAQNTCLW